MNLTPERKVIIIGAGIAGLSAGIYARLNGYHSQIFEMHSLPGGLMTAWKRKGYTIDGCIHWLTGSSPLYSYYRLWQEIGLIQGREIYDPEIFYRAIGKNGEELNVYCDADRLEKHLLDLSPEDEKVIRDFCRSVRAVGRYKPQIDGDIFSKLLGFFTIIPLLPILQKYSRMTMKDFGEWFKNPFLKESWAQLMYPNISALAMVMTLAMLHNRSAGYTMGGSLPMAHAVEKRYLDLGGNIQYNTRVSKILVEGDCAVGVKLADGREERADVVISAADGHATIFDMLEGRYINDQWRQIYNNYPIFPPLLFIGLGLNRTFSDLPGITGGISIELEQPLMVGGELVNRLDVMVYNFDPSLAPQGKTVMSIMIPTNYAYWKALEGERERYEAEKQQAAIQVIQQLDQHFPGLAGQVEMADVASPLTFERYTGNWQGSFEGWLPTPQTLLKTIPKVLPGLDNFYMVGQWVQPGGGLPSGVMTAREVVQKICKQDGVKFRTE
jgi:phytoene dehydrogenase-like protein